VGFSYALFLIERARVYSFADGDVERMRVYAKEAVASGDLILAVTNPALQAIHNNYCFGAGGQGGACTCDRRRAAASTATRRRSAATASAFQRCWGSEERNGV
jgi:hypothetical protein